jgi:hypothetical protein
VSVIGWCGDASVLTFQRPTRRAKSPCVGNIHYRHLPGYRLEVKTVGSGASSRAELRSSALASVNFLFFWDGRPRRPAIRKCSGCLVGKNSGELGRRFLHRGKRKHDTDVGPTNPVSLPGVFKNRGDVGGCALDVNRPKA